MFFESLENRLCKTGSIDGSGVVTFTGTDSTETLSLTVDENDILHCKINGHTDFQVSNSHGTVTGVQVGAMNGDDTILNVTDFRTTLNGGSGNDSISGGTDIDSMRGTGGNDTLVGNDGNDCLNGGSSADVLDGGAGNDNAMYDDFTVNLNISMDGVANDGGSGEGDNVLSCENVFGGSGNDSITGDAAANLLSGGAGNDTLRGGDGVDKLLGGTGSDRAYGDAGIDLYTLSGDNTADGYSYDGSDFLAIDPGLDFTI